jgi:nucleoside 2-deoxyribosyltransferase
MSKVYLAGHITGMTYNQATSWREYTTEILAKLGVQALSPMRGKEFLASAATLIPNDGRFGHISPTASPGGITGRDRNDVRTSDVILMNLQGEDKISAGSMIELGWADAWRKPVVLVVDEDADIARHVMVETIATYITTSQYLALQLVALLLGIPAAEFDAEVNNG